MLIGKGIISPFQREILQAFSRLQDSRHFFLTGGTALAEFYFGHRKSFDLDLFSREKALIIPFSRSLETEFGKCYTLKVIRRFETFVELEAGSSDEAIRLQLAYDSPFRFEEPLDSQLGIRVNDYKDIITDKLLAFFGRAEPRDAIDLFFILKQVDFWELIELARSKDTGFDLYWLAVAFERSLEFPDEIEKWPVEMLVEVDPGELKQIFRQIKRKTMEKLKGQA
jgi:hypothetical protein